MNITVPIPDALASTLGPEADLPRRALEALVLEEYRAGRLTTPDLRALLGIETRDEMDGFLKAHSIFSDFTLDEIQQQVQAMEQLGL